MVRIVHSFCERKGPPPLEVRATIAMVWNYSSFIDRVDRLKNMKQVPLVSFWKRGLRMLQYL
jgi:hypothetical protein